MDPISVAGNVMLTSTVEEDARHFACEEEMVTFTCQVIGSLSLQWRSPLIHQIGFTTDPADPVSVSRPPFIATLTLYCVAIYTMIPLKHNNAVVFKIDKLL